MRRERGYKLALAIIVSMLCSPQLVSAQSLHWYPDSLVITHDACSQFDTAIKVYLLNPSDDSAFIAQYGATAAGWGVTKAPKGWGIAGIVAPHDSAEFTVTYHSGST